MKPDPSLLALATIEAPHAYAQEEVRSLSQELFGDAEFDAEEKSAVFMNGGIRRRTFALPLEAYLEGFSNESRNAHFVEVATGMLRRAAEEALADSPAEAITHVITVTTSGVSTPSLECSFLAELAVPPSVRRVPVFGLGCGGGAAGLQLARDLAAASPDVRVLVLCVELTSLTLLAEDKSLRNFVACAIFGDGGAAAVVGTPRSEEEPLARLGQGRCHLFPDSLDLMGWDVREAGWRVRFSPRIPQVVKRHAGELVRSIFAGERPRHFALHPGGQRILDAYRSALELSDDELAHASGCLAHNGNMSAASVFFVLDGLLRQDDPPQGSGVLTAFGPGFTAEVLALDFGD